MAMYEAVQSGYCIRCLVTFAPPQAKFLAHPLSFITLQAEALSLPHYILPVVAPFEESYEMGLLKLRDEMDIRCVITGDIAEVDNKPNWIRERCRPLGIQVHTPLWQRDRLVLLQHMLARGMKVRISAVNTRWLDSSWVGRELDDRAVSRLREHGERTGLDPCGEEGEYHTLVVDGPQFLYGIDIGSYSTCFADPLAYMEINETEKRNKKQEQSDKELI